MPARDDDDRDRSRRGRRSRRRPITLYFIRAEGRVRPASHIVWRHWTATDPERLIDRTFLFDGRGHAATVETIFVGRYDGPAAAWAIAAARLYAHAVRFERMDAAARSGGIDLDQSATANLAEAKARHWQLVDALAAAGLRPAAEPSCVG